MSFEPIILREIFTSLGVPLDSVITSRAAMVSANPEWYTSKSIKLNKIALN